MKYDSMERFRIDSLTNMFILDETGIDIQNVRGIDKDFNFNTFFSTSATILPGRPIHAKMYIGGFKNLSASIDYFGQENIENIIDPEVDMNIYQPYYTITIHCNDISLFNWALNPFNRSYIVEPSEIREYVSQILQSCVDCYNMDPNIPPNEWPDE